MEGYTEPMPDRVVFDDEASVPLKASPALSTEQKLTGRGIVTNIGNASFLLVLVVAGLIGGAFYFLASAIPETPELGADVPRPGEKIPKNRSL